MMTPAISIQNVWKYFRLYHDKNQYLKTTLLQGRRARFEEFWALKDVSFDIEHGSTFGIIGSNGSGKSTLLKCMAGILSPDEGVMTCNGRMAALLELGAGFHPELSGRENIYLNGAILGMNRSEIKKKLDDIIDFSGLNKFIDAPVKNYSSGMVVRLGFSIATNVDPEILIIDEVLAVGDESFQQRCYEKIESFRQDGRTIVLVSHGLTQVAQLCSTVVWLENGKVKETGPAYEIINKYTGQSHDSYPKLENDLGNRWGTGEAVITQIELLSNQAKKSLFNPKDPFTIRIHYFCPTPITDPVFGVRISHIHGLTIWGTNTKRRGHRISCLSGEGHIDLVVPSLPLLEGTFDLTVALSDLSEVHQYDHWENRVRFEVAQDKTFDEGITFFQAEWKH